MVQSYGICKFDTNNLSTLCKPKILRDSLSGNYGHIVTSVLHLVTLGKGCRLGLVLHLHGTISC